MAKEKGQDKKERKGQKPAQQEAKAPAEAARHSAKETPRLKTRFVKEIAPALMKELDRKNPMAVPHLHKIVVNMGVGEATQNAKVLDPAVNELTQITGQKPVTTRAKKSIAAFKVREGPGHRRHGHAARRPHVRIFRPLGECGIAARARFSRGLDQVV